MCEVKVRARIIVGEMVQREQEEENSEDRKQNIRLLMPLGVADRSTTYDPFTSGNCLSERRTNRKSKTRRKGCWERGDADGCLKEQHEYFMLQ